MHAHGHVPAVLGDPQRLPSVSRKHLGETHGFSLICEDRWEGRGVPTDRENKGSPRLSREVGKVRVDNNAVLCCRRAPSRMAHNRNICRTFFFFFFSRLYLRL